MSNITDLGDLSDLLRTSPSQPSESRKSAPNDGPAANKLNIVLEESVGKPQDANGIVAEEPNEGDTAVEKQEQKLLLSQQRSDLILERAGLKTKVQELQLKLAKYQAENIKQTNKEQEDRDKEEKLEKELLEQLNDEETTDDPLSQLNVLPSTNWEKRLKLAKQFFPLMEIDRMNSTVHNEQDRILKIVSFKLLFPLLFKIGINLSINLNDDSIEKVELLNNTMFLISPLLCLDQFVKDNNLSLIVYSLNSYANILNTRILTFTRIVTTYPELVNSDMVSSSTIRNYANLKSRDHLILKKGGKKLVLQWTLVLGEIILGEFESVLKLFLLEEDIDSILPESNNVNELFLGLLPKYGVCESIGIIIDKVFEAI